jgi:hypothetical protein
MKKIEYIDLIKSRVSSETFDGIHPEIVSKWIAVKFNNLFTKRITEGLNLDVYSRPYMLDVASDPSYGYCCVLPVQPLVVPGYRSGIYRVTVPKSSIQCVPVESNAADIFHILDVAKSTKSFYYTVSNGKIIFDERKWDPMIGQVRVYILLSFESYDDDDDIDIPDGKFTDQLCQILMGSPAPKEINDNAKSV